MIAVHIACPCSTGFRHFIGISPAAILFFDEIECSYIACYKCKHTVFRPVSMPACGIRAGILFCTIHPMKIGRLFYCGRFEITAFRFPGTDPGITCVIKGAANAVIAGFIFCGIGRNRIVVGIKSLGSRTAEGFFPCF